MLLDTEAAELDGRDPQVLPETLLAARLRLIGDAQVLCDSVHNMRTGQPFELDLCSPHDTVASKSIWDVIDILSLRARPQIQAQHGVVKTPFPHTPGQG